MLLQLLKSSLLEETARELKAKDLPAVAISQQNLEHCTSSALD